MIRKLDVSADRPAVPLPEKLRRPDIVARIEATMAFNAEETRRILGKAEAIIAQTRAAPSGRIEEP